MTADASKPRPDFAATFERVVQRYRECGRFARGYVAAKLRRDPVHRDVLALAANEAFGDVVDIGCGRGQLAVALLEAGRARSVLGLDCHAGHLEQARLAATGLAFTAAVQDIAETLNVPHADTVLLIDVLYQLESAAQIALLRATAGAARQRILIRTLDPDRGMRSAFTLGLERLTRCVSPHSGRHVDALPVAKITETLSEFGFVVSITPCWQGTPFANVLIMARCPADR
jgi:2-polyprenyl-3-methyl-5-hydroxy-6-metoxy-1,4-benzoquinol methylase